MTTALLIISLIFLAVALYMGWRNGRVYKIRIAILNIEPIQEGLDLYKYLPSYHEMIRSIRKPLTYEYWLQYVTNRRNIK